MHQFTAPFRGGAAAGVGHDTPVSDQVSDNGTEHSGISVPGPGRLATGKIIKRRPSEVLRDEAVESHRRHNDCLGGRPDGPRNDRAAAGRRANKSMCLKRSDRPVRRTGGDAVLCCERLL